MKQVQIVSPDFVNQVWDKIEHLFEKSFKVSTDDCTLDQLRLILVQGQQVLFACILNVCAKSKQTILLLKVVKLALICN